MRITFWWFKLKVDLLNTIVVECHKSVKRVKKSERREKKEKKREKKREKKELVNSLKIKSKLIHLPGHGENRYKAWSGAMHNALV